jgi:hypothetical protein
MSEDRTVRALLTNGVARSAIVEGVASLRVATLGVCRCNRHFRMTCHHGCAEAALACCERSPASVKRHRVAPNGSLVATPTAAVGVTA